MESTPVKSLNRWMPLHNPATVHADWIRSLAKNWPNFIELPPCPLAAVEEALQSIVQQIVVADASSKTGVGKPDLIWLREVDRRGLRLAQQPALYHIKLLGG